MNSRKALLVLIVIAVLAGGWSLISALFMERMELLPAWQVTASKRFRASAQLDPFVTWSPDSKAILFAGYGANTPEQKIYEWPVGAKRIRPIVDGASPNYVTDDQFIYLKSRPKAIFLRSLSANAERETLAALKDSEYWKEVTGFTYNPKRDRITLRLIEEAHFYTPGTDEYDLKGKFSGSVVSRTSDQIMDFSSSPDGSKSAILVQGSEGMMVSLQIATGTRERGKEIDYGSINCVAWSPNGKLIAYGDEAKVIALSPSSHAKVVVGSFADSSDREDNKRYVFRLSWSPDSRYLAVFVYVPDIYVEYPLIYVLDASKFRW